MNIMHINTYIYMFMNIKRIKQILTRCFRFCRDIFNVKPVCFQYWCLTGNIPNVDLTIFVQYWHYI